jgi:hypothetical protein
MYLYNLYNCVHIDVKTAVKYIHGEQPPSPLSITASRFSVLMFKSDALVRIVYICYISKSTRVLPVFTRQTRHK